MLKNARFVVVLSALLLGVPSLGYAADGSCHFDSDCASGVKCKSSKCATAAGSSCNFDSDCGGGGAKCNRGKCSNAPDGTCHFDSECAGVGKCGAGGKCKKYLLLQRTETAPARYTIRLRVGTAIAGPSASRRGFSRPRRLSNRKATVSWRGGAAGVVGSPAGRAVTS